MTSSEWGETAELVEQLRSGGAQAAPIFDRQYRESLVRFCWGYLGDIADAEDAVQEIAFKVLTAENIPDRFRPWLYRVARNHCLNLLRDRARRRDRFELPTDARVRASMTGNLTRLVRDEDKRIVIELVQRLPESQREVLRLRYVEGLSRAEIAEVLELSESVVKSRLFEGLQRLRNSTGSAQDT
ncbi:MAG: sigma-70 family RNA polymerase sigma factor [Phycisphaerae bacterium]|nr:sigma-70 family RNA polymerase sigma factor [Phycisphaerae bacterium]